MSLLLLFRPLGTPGPPQPPSIVSFLPPSGPVGTVVVITGSSFTGATDVSFNGTSAIVFSVDNDGQITATVPVGATTGKIAVTTAIGTGTSATDFTVTVPVVVVPPQPVFDGAGGITQWTIEFPKAPKKKRVVLTRNTEGRDQDDIERIVDLLNKEGLL